MSGDDPAWRRMPVLRALFEKWRSARGRAAPGSFQRAFRIGWEDLLAAAGIEVIEQRREAQSDVFTLEAENLIEVRTERGRKYQIETIVLPLASEDRLRALFADELPAPGEERIDLTTIDWHPTLAFVPSARLGIAAEDLLKLNAFLLKHSGKNEGVPVKERSLEIFGDEKRLDALRTTRLFDDGRLSLGALGCFPVSEPLGWQRGPHLGGPLLVIENAATWDSYCRWNAVHGYFAGVVYGGGNRFMDSAVRLEEIFAELGGARPVLYFGDLDAHGIRIPQIASVRVQRRGLPAIEADLWSYSLLLQTGTPQPAGIAESEYGLSDRELTWLGEHAQPAGSILARGCRLAQEWIGWERLSGATRS